MTRYRRPARPARVLAAAALGLAVVLTGCGTDPGADTRPPLSTTEHNAADVAFASDLIRRHAVSLSLVDLTLGRDLDPGVQRLVGELRATQSAQVETASGWLLRWGEPIPQTVRDHSSVGHGDSPEATEGDGIGGAPSGLTDLPPAQFQQAWLRAMADHHEDTIARARAHQDAGQFEPAVEMGEQLVSQHAERLTAIKQLLAD